MPLSVSTALSDFQRNLKGWLTGSDPAFIASEQEAFLDEAVTEYSNYKPIQTQTSLSVIAGQATYSFPAGAIRIVPMMFSLDGSFLLGNSGSYYDLGQYLSVGYASEMMESIALRLRRQVLNAAIAQARYGNILVDNDTRVITLSPSPTITATGYLIGHYPHLKTGTVGSYQYATIPTEHAPYVISYAQGLILKALALAYSTEEMKVGDRQIGGVKIAQFLDDKGEKSLKEMTSRLKMPVVVT